MWWKFYNFRKKLYKHRKVWKFYIDNIKITFDTSGFHRVWLKQHSDASKQLKLYNIMSTNSTSNYFSEKSLKSRYNIEVNYHKNLN